MKLDLKRRLKDHKGEQIWADDKHEKELTAGDLAIEGLLSSVQGDQSSGDEKMTKWKLAQKIHSYLENKEEEVLDIAVEQVALIKKEVGRRFPTPFVGAFFHAIEDSPRAV